MKKTSLKLFAVLVFPLVMGSHAYAKPFFQTSVITGSTPTPLLDLVDPIQLAGDGRFVGTGKVGEIKKSDSPNDVCNHAQVNAETSDSRCAQEIWIYQKQDQLILIYAPTQDDIDNNQIRIFGVDGRYCETTAKLSDAISRGIFELLLCSGALPPDRKAGGTIGLTSSEGNPPSSPTYHFAKGAKEGKLVITDKSVTISTKSKVTGKTEVIVLQRLPLIYQ
jgi:hypothetical protein